MEDVADAALKAAGVEVPPPTAPTARTDEAAPGPEDPAKDIADAVLVAAGTAIPSAVEPNAPAAEQDNAAVDDTDVVEAALAAVSEGTTPAAQRKKEADERARHAAAVAAAAAGERARRAEAAAAAAAAAAADEAQNGEARRAAAAAAEEQAKKEADERAQKEADERARKEQERSAAAERARKETEERTRKELEARKDSELKARAEKTAAAAAAVDVDRDRRLQSVPSKAWTVADVGMWLAKEGEAQFVPAFEDRRIDGEALLLLQPTDLADLGVTALADRKRVLAKIDALRGGGAAGGTPLPPPPPPLAAAAPVAAAPAAAPPGNANSAIPPAASARGPAKAANAAAAPAGRSPSISLIDDWALARSEVTLTKEIGRGRVGAVYLAVFNDTKVVAKEVTGGLDAAKRKQARDEAALMKRVCEAPHENVARFYGAAVDDRGIFAVVELCELGTLHAYLLANAALTLAEQLAISTQTARGMAHLHALKPPVLHRALSSRTVLLSRRAGALVAKVSEFGLLRDLPNEENDFEVVRATAAPARWSAPEVLAAGTFYKGSDVWAFGVTVWEIYSNGALPYGRRTTDADVLAGVPNKKLALLQPERCPTPVWELVKQACFAYQAHDRAPFGDIADRLAATEATNAAPLPPPLSVATAPGAGPPPKAGTPAAASPPPRPGTPLGAEDWILARREVTLTKEIGRGSAGGACQGVFNNSKVLAREALGALDAARRKEVLDEAAVLRRACLAPHPNVALFYGVVIDNRGVLAVTELCELGSLANYMATNPMLDPVSQLNVCVHVARGMAHLHSLKPAVLHKMLNTRNVLLTRRDGMLVAKVSEFGLLRKMPREDGGFEPVTPASLVASPRWSAPEVLGARVFYKSSDVWAFGVTAWEVYSNGAVPYGRRTSDAEVAEGVPSKKLALQQPENCPDEVWSAIKGSCFAYLANERLPFADVAERLGAVAASVAAAAAEAEAVAAEAAAAAAEAAAAEAAKAAAAAEAAAALRRMPIAGATPSTSKLLPPPISTTALGAGSAPAAAAAAAAKASPGPEDGVLSRHMVTLTKEVGRGRNGGAYLAVYNNSKVLARELLVSLDAAKRKEALDEVAMLRRACNPPHPNVVVFYGAVVDGRGILAVTDVTELGALQPYLAANSKMDSATRLTFCVQIARGMAHLHGFKPAVLHRSLSARSVRLGRREGALVARVADMGILRTLPREEFDYDLAKEAASPLATSSRWLAPEVLSARTFNKGSDVWAFGVTAWEVYSSGALPYGADVNDALVAAGVPNKKMSLAQPTGCPEGIWSLIKTSCFAYLAHDRRSFAEIAEMLADPSKRGKIAPGRGGQDKAAKTPPVTKTPTSASATTPLAATADAKTPTTPTAIATTSAAATSAAAKTPTSPAPAAAAASPMAPAPSPMVAAAPAAAAATSPSPASPPPSAAKSPTSPTSPAAAAAPRKVTLGQEWVIARSEVTFTKELGRGRLGAVYLAVFDNLKVIAKENITPLTAIKTDEARDEAALMRRVSQPPHPNVAVFYGAAIDTRGVLAITELGDLGELRRYLIANPKLDLSTRLALSIHVARGMAHLHGFKPMVLHKTLSARAVQVVRRDGGIVAKVADYGLLRTMPREENDYETPKSAVPPRSSAPEVIGARTFYKTSDVWSFGVTVWEIYSNGEEPYGRDVTDAEVLELVPSKKLALMQPDICPTPVWTLVKASCLAYQAHDRRTFSDVAERLKLMAPADLNI